MAVEVQVYLPGDAGSFSLDDYITALSLMALSGTYDRVQSLPDTIIYSNPKTGVKSRIGTDDMRSN